MPDDLDDIFAPEHAKAFVLRHLKPADCATERAVEALRIELGQRRNEGNRRALCGFLWACQLLSNRRSDLLAFPSSKPAYDEDGGGYKAFMSVKQSLLSQGYISQRRVSAADHGRATIFQVLKAPDTKGLNFEEYVPTCARLIQVKRQKVKYGWQDGNDKAPPMRKRQIENLFGKERADLEEAKVRKIVNYLTSHPLHMNDTMFRGLKRIFNNGSFERGGRLYGGYSSLPKTFRYNATIDGEPIAQLDIKASYLCVRAGLAGYQFEEGSDPYQLVPWVDQSNHRTRDFAKQLISTLIASGGDKPKMPIKLRADYPDIVQPRQSINHFKKPIHEVFPFLLDHVDGLEVMFRESEMMVATLHTCIDEDVPAWPLHDCIFVRKSDTARATEIIKSEFSKLFGFKPTVTLDEDSIL